MFFIVMSIALLALAFLFPLGLFPLQDFVRDFTACLSAVFLFFFACSKVGDKVRVPVLIVFLSPLLILFSVYFYFANGLLYSYYLYSFSFLYAVAVLFSVSEIKLCFESDLIIKVFAKFLLFTAAAASLLALSRYYGVLKILFPIISEDGNRLIGPMGQPNLMAILILCGVAALWYLVFVDKSASKLLGLFMGLLFFYCLPLTGSRAWLINYLILLCVCIFWAIRSPSLRVSNFSRQSWYQSLPIVSLLSFFVFSMFLVPEVDRMISEPLIESGFVNRTDPNVNTDRLTSSSSSGRLREWSKTTSGTLPDSLYFGNGLGRYGEFSNRAELEMPASGNGQVWNHAHNIFIMFFVEWGLLGLLLISVLFFYVVFVLLYPSLKKVDDSSFLPLSVICFFLFHNLVEFSLWNLSFLGLLLFSIAYLDRTITLKLSSKFLVRAVSVAVFLFVFPVSIYMAKDAFKTIDLMYKERLEDSDIYALDDLSRNRVIGYAPMLVKAAKVHPVYDDGGRELRRFEELSEWRPYPLFVSRVAALSVLYYPYDKACQKIAQSIRLYPDSVSTIQRDVAQINLQLSEDEKNPIDISQCVLTGASYWVE